MFILTILTSIIVVIKTVKTLLLFLTIQTILANRYKAQKKAKAKDGNGRVSLSVVGEVCTW